MDNISTKVSKGIGILVTGDTYDIRPHEILLKRKWKTLDERSEEQTISLVNKALNYMCPPNITSMFQIAHNKNYNLRSNNNFKKC